MPNVQGSNVVVVGGGFAGLSAAARLAKLNHRVTLVEASARLGGRLRGTEVDGRSWQLDCPTVTLPGVFRDLFRKSGRPLEKSLELTSTPLQRHLFPSGPSVEVLDLAVGDRAHQIDAMRSAFDVPELAVEWAEWIDAWPDRWDVLRRRTLDRVPDGRRDLDRPARKTLDVRRSVRRLTDKQLDDDRLRQLVLDPVRLDGQDPALTPSFVAVQHYLDRTFGRWAFTGGFEALADALEKRLGERKVTICLEESAHELTFSGSGDARAVTAVVTDRRSLPAEVVVWCAPTWPAPLPAPRALQTIPAARTLLTLGPDAPALPQEVVAHTDPPVRLWPGEDGQVTVVGRGGEDPVIALVRAGLDLRPHVVDRTALSPSDLVRLGHWGWQWHGWTTIDDHPGVSPRAGLYFAGAHAWPGGTPEAIGMATAAIAEAVGPAPRLTPSG